MLSFFVLLFSMSTIQESDWQNLVDSLSTKLDRVQQVSVALPQSDKSAEAVQREPGTDLDYLAAVLKEQMQANRSEEHTSELQSLMRISSAVFCLYKKTTKQPISIQAQCSIKNT